METQPDGPQILFALVRLFPGPGRDVQGHQHASSARYVLHSNEKKRARLNGIKHILSQIPYKRIKRDKIKLPRRSNKDRYKDDIDVKKVKLVKEVY